jgi:hypothetical protein
MLQTPVALLIFNRPDATERVFREIARAQPRRLFIIADGPRPERPGEAERCAATRAIVEQIDWECTVTRNYAEANLGCRARVASGITWLFEQVEEAIILEDDCVPQPSFFAFCEELLARYRDDQRVMMISGTNTVAAEISTPYSYFFALPSICWGWASWRRAWQNYDLALSQWPELRASAWLDEVWGSQQATRYWQKRLDREQAWNRAAAFQPTWDYQWFYSCWAQNSLAICPAVNLVSNIGFGEGATHTRTTLEGVYIPSAEITFPLQHPPHLVWNREADRRRMRQLLTRMPWYRRLFRTIYSHTPQSLRRQISLLRSRRRARHINSVSA